MRWCRRFFLVFVLVAGICFAGHSELYAAVAEKGAFLVAAEQMVDPRFRDRVILLIQHDVQGSAGLVVNRTSRLSLESVLPQDSKLSTQGKTLSYGGPVEPQTLLALIKVRNLPPEPAEEIVDGIYVTGVGVLNDWSDFADEVIDYRAFVGYTGWAPGQLAVEMKQGDWLVVPADAEAILSGGGVELWERLQEQGVMKN